MSLASALSYLGREALRIVLPSACVVCGHELPWRDRVASCCGPCWAALPRIANAKCRSCAQPAAITDLSEFVCVACHRDPLPLDWCDAWGEYRDGLERLLHALKFARHDFLDDALASLVEQTFREHHDDETFDALVPVPMSGRRERRRGYNQAELLSRALSFRVGVPCDMTLLTRRTDAATQSTLPRRERAANVRTAFRASPAAKGKSILIIDDICTTGETLRACANALRASGAERVCAVVVAKAT
jgi:ComF family protein